MRIISGQAKNYPLKAPKGRNIRPVTDKIKGAIFNALRGNLKGAYVLDLFAGSGSIGIEALSRGAQKAVFVDSNRHAVNTIRQNLKKHFEEKAEVIRGECIRTIRRLGRKNYKFDLVFSDPPYQLKVSQKILEELEKSDVIRKDGIVVTRYRKDEILPNEINDFTKVFEKTYGDSKVNLWSRTSNGQ